MHLKIIILIIALLALCRSQDCTGTTQRKEVREMKAEGNFELFVTAFKTMSTDGTLASLVNIHVNQ
jgi:hypothetical protein